MQNGLYARTPRERLPTTTDELSRVAEVPRSVPTTITPTPPYFSAEQLQLFDELLGELGGIQGLLGEFMLLLSVKLLRMTAILVRSIVHKIRMIAGDAVADDRLEWRSCYICGRSEP